MKLSINADAIVATSDITVADIVLLKQHKPEALKLKDKEGNDTFAIGYREGGASVTPKGVVFGGTSRDGEGKATITAVLPQGLAGDAAKAYVADMFGAVMENVAALEKSVPAAAKAVSDARKSLVDSITIA